MLEAMSVCPACGAEGVTEGEACPKCWHVAGYSGPDLALDVPAPPAPKPKAPPPKKKVEEDRIDFAVDMASIRPQVSVPPPVSERVPKVPSLAAPPSSSADAVPVLAAANAPARPNAAAAPLAIDRSLEASTLANYGDAPSNIVLAPLYAYRVYKRRAELRAVLAGRREEAAQASRALEDAMCALGERVRPLAANDPQAARSLQLLKDAEDLLRTRDATLAREQDAHRERLRANEARIAGIEAELVAAKSEERAASQVLADAQAAVQRAEAKLKRADIELRNIAAAQAAARKTGA